MKEGESKGPFQCNLGDCTAVLKRQADLYKHQRYSESHATHAYKCPECKHEFTRPDAFSRHFNDQTPKDSNLKCRDNLRLRVEKHTWSKDIPEQLRDAFKVPFNPKVLLGQKQ